MTRSPNGGRSRSPGSGEPPCSSQDATTAFHASSISAFAASGVGSATSTGIGVAACSSQWTGRTITFARRTRSAPITHTGSTVAPVWSASRNAPRLGVPRPPWRSRVPSGKIASTPPRWSTWRAVSIASGSDSPRRTGKQPRRDTYQPARGRANSSALPMKHTGRDGGNSSPSRNGSRNERWFATTSTGPSAGIASIPVRVSRR